MKNLFAISNIAWGRHDDPAVLDLLAEYGISGIEVAPTKIWPDLTVPTERDVRRYADFLNERGFSVPAFQAILFGCPELQVFNQAMHKAFFERLEWIARMASWMGAKVLVFGAPKNRKRNGLCYAEAFRKATLFFKEAGKIVGKYSCVLGIEANPVEYQCDFLTNTADAEMLVQAVDSPEVALHIDSGATMMTNENIADVIENRKIPFVHYHVSEPMLENVANGSVNHRAAFKALKRIGYHGAISIEMKMKQPELENLEAALKTVTGLINDSSF